MDLEAGQLVKSLAGRDKERLYIVIGFENDRVLLSDGQYRPLKKPKKKNIKHLQPYRCLFTEITEKMYVKKLNDTFIRNILNNVLSSESIQENEENDYNL